MLQVTLFIFHQSKPTLVFVVHYWRLHLALVQLCAVFQLVELCPENKKI